VIFEAIVTAVCGFLSFIGSAMPTIELPAWVSDLAGLVSQISGWAAPLGNWLPFGAMGTALQFVLVCLVIAFLVKLVRIIASFMTAGGGSAA